MPISTIKMEKQNSDIINKTEKWKILPSMKITRKWFGLAAIGEKVYVTGGYNKNNVELSSAEINCNRSDK